MLLVLLQGQGCTNKFRFIILCKRCLFVANYYSTFWERYNTNMLLSRSSFVKNRRKIISLINYCPKNIFSRNHVSDRPITKQKTMISCKLLFVSSCVLVIVVKSKATAWVSMITVTYTYTYIWGYTKNVKFTNFLGFITGNNLFIRAFLAIKNIYVIYFFLPFL